METTITSFNNLEHRDQVISLWKKVFGYSTDHNKPGLVIDKKLEVMDGLFFVALDDQNIIGTVMAGYDGHRGWVYSMAVSPDYKNQGIGTSLLSFAEKALSDLGCLKINLQIVEGNEAVEGFYLKNGYQTEKRVSMGKRLLENIVNTEPANSTKR